MFDSLRTLKRRGMNALGRIPYYARTGYWHSGERVNPDFPDENFQNHFKVYQFLKQLAANRMILDVGCGTGYGTAFLAPAARQITGIDLSRPAIRFAKSRYRQPNLSYLLMDAQALSFADNAFDLIVSTENFEHLADQRQHLRELARVLLPGGTCFIATPNPEMFVGIHNPYHTKENNYKELESLLAASFNEFSIIENMSQPPTAAGASAREARWAAGHRGLDPRQEASPLGIRLDRTYLHNTHSFFCFARKALA